jgi:CDP-glycerol glycerophosphotransferase (TagB/SpsB family)
MNDAPIAFSPPATTRRTRKSTLIGWIVWVPNLLVAKRDDRAILYGHPPLNDGVLAMLEGLIARGIECDLIVDDPRSGELVRDEALRRGVRRIHQRHQARTMLAYARARYVFVTSALYRSHPVRRQRLVNLWHGAFTKLIDSRPVFRGIRGVPVTATSRLGAAFRTVEFDVQPRDVMLVGSPRNDRLLSADRAESRERLGLPAGALILLWLPTFRESGQDRIHPPAPSDSDLAELEPWLAAHNALLVLKHHPFAPPVGASVHPHVRVIPHDGPPMSLSDLMAASDGLITDFSSAWADYLLLDRPIWIHWPDFAEWSAVDNIPLAPLDRWLPGPLTTSVADLAKELAAHFDGESGVWEDRRGWLKAVFHHYCDAGSTSRLLDALGVPDGS